VEKIIIIKTTSVTTTITKMQFTIEDMIFLVQTRKSRKVKSYKLINKISTLSGETEYLKFVSGDFKKDRCFFGDLEFSSLVGTEAPGFLNTAGTVFSPSRQIGDIFNAGYNGIYKLENECFQALEPTGDYSFLKFIGYEFELE